MPRVYVRKFDWEEARARHAAGETIVALAREYGVSNTAVRHALFPAERRANAERIAKIQRSGTCPDCGGPSSFNYTSGSHRCRTCDARAKATTAREGELLCCTCKEWKPDEDFPWNRSRTLGRRGRHAQCRCCLTIARREYRHRNPERERAYSRAYKRKRRSALQKATSAVRDDGTRIQPVAEEAGKPPREKEISG